MVAMISLLLLQVIGCNQEVTYSQSTLELNKEGSIVATLIESFDEDYYDLSELNRINEEEIGDFNAANGEELVVIEESILEGSNIKLTMTYANSVAYSELNEVILFSGTIEEAYDAGYDLDVILKNVDDEEDTIGRLDLLSMASKHIVIIEEPMDVYTFNNILYVSSGITTSSNKKLVTVTGERVAYIVFK